MSDAWADDRALAARITAGDQASLSSLVAALHRPLMRVAEAWVGAGAAADDLVQETWEALIDHAGEFQARSSLRTWLTRILVNRAKTRLTRAGREQPLPEADGSDGDPLDGRFGGFGFWRASPAIDMGPEEALLQAEAASWLADALEGLPRVQRAVVTLRDIEDWTADEVCNALGLSESNQRVLLHRGRTRLRAELEKKQRARTK